MGQRSGVSLRGQRLSPPLALLQVSLGLQVRFEEGVQSEVLPAGGAAVRCLCAVDTAVSGEAGAEAKGFWTLWAPVGLLSTVGVAVVLQ